jgi:hypothetical protein
MLGFQLVSYIRVDLYFEFVHPSFPILHKSNFLTSLLLPPPLRPQSTIILRAIVACAASYARLDSRLEVIPYLISLIQNHADTLRTSYSSDTAYHQRIIDYTLDSPSLKSLQALAILALSYISSGFTGRLWGVMAILTRLVTSMSLHTIDGPLRYKEQPFLKSLPLLSNTTQMSDVEERRRCFWAIFMLDRFVSASTGWQAFILTKDVRVHLPSLESDFQMSPEHLTENSQHSPGFSGSVRDPDSWALCMESVDILSRVIEWLQLKWNFQDSYMREKDGLAFFQKMEAWREGIPETMRLSENISKHDCGNIMLLHATFNA